MTEQRAGRPKLSSPETIAEAACELFFERGYDATSIVDIALRAGVSRSSFFNYFTSKSDILWSSFDARVDALRTSLRPGVSAPSDVRSALQAFAAGFAPDTLALAMANAVAMGLEEELDRESAVRTARIGRAVAAALRPEVDLLAADVVGSAAGGAVLAAVRAWAAAGPGRTSLSRTLEDAVGVVAPLLAPRGGVRQLRLVVRSADLDGALSVYRDTLGMTESQAFAGPDGARVAILEAGRATLELANAAQVRFIDAVETGGGESDRMRVALEVDDVDAAAGALMRAGARLEARPAQTPWRSRNARLRGPDDLQLTVFQELDPE
ncbi:TetR family transcriptional regulator [Microbacterium sp. ET2]|uniref:TetR family transcriptional regulator n=1 Tax=Microbacterium albipurpureum TaxID=3050384 RepID=UPI00259CC70C|nr:TetR family transcriptional regulator [Microbacterium sp. ET2 (Ac-2212)]WJL95777.1 TetR family transcriptional regulator [Microbacterium sp. ET2 (Ac-2212)]